MNEEYDFYLVKKLKVAKDTYEFTLKSDIKYLFEPGQYAYFRCGRIDSTNSTRIFSFVNPPNDNNTIVIVARMRPSVFKNALDSIPVGGQLRVSRPIGYFCLDRNSEVPSVLIAGGIGIAPFMSIVETEIVNRSNRSIALFYSNRSLKTSIYLDKIANATKYLPNFKSVLFMTRTKTILPTFNNQRITAEYVLNTVSHAVKSLYYIAGPPMMVEDITDELISLGISSQRIKIESFTGY